MDIIRKYPRQYDYEEIDVKNQIILDIEKSNTIGTKINKHKIKVVSKKILYFLTFAFIFSRRARIQTKRVIDNNTNVIQAIAVIVMILLTLYIIYLMNKN